MKSTRGARIVALLALLASGLMIAASFLPWLGSDSTHVIRLNDGSQVQTVTGWAIYESERDAGENGLIIWRIFTDAGGHPVPFFTGLSTLISALVLAVVTIISLALHRPVRPEEPRRRLGCGRLLVGVVLMALLVPAVMVPGTNAAFYFQNDAAAAGISLQYGLIVLWAATIVAWLGSFSLSPVYVPRTKRPTQAE